MTSVFSRSSRPLPVAASANGAWVTDTEGRLYLDAAGGAIVVGIGHGDRIVVDAMATQAASVAYVHGTAFTTDAMERYAARLAALVPMDDARVYPVSGGSEAMETALKMARSFHLARGEDRPMVVGRAASYHGNTRGALDVSGREPLRSPYLPWLGQTLRAPAPDEYRCPNPGHPEGCARWHRDALEALLAEAGPERVAAFVAEPIGGAASGAMVPPDGYWEAITEVCRDHGILVIADEVMTGFGRTGEWFAADHFGLRPDILVSAKGASSGYWPLGLAITSGPVHDTIAAGGGLVHGFTWSHHPVGAAVGNAVLDRIEELRLIDRARVHGSRLHDALRASLGDHPHVGDIRGRGLLACVELVADREDKTPFPRAKRVTEQVVERAKEGGLLVYSSTGNVDGADGDYLLLGPPLTILDDEVDLIVDRLAMTLAGLR